MRHLRLLFSLASLAALAALFALRPAPAETCLSPFVKRIDRPEKHLYVFCVDADAKDNDFLIVIDVDKKSKTCGTITYQLDLGSKGNETHHFGFTDDRTHIWGCSLFSNLLFVINVSDNPARPKLVKTIDSSAKTGLTGPHSPYARRGMPSATWAVRTAAGRPAGCLRQRRAFVETIAHARRPHTATTLAINPARTHDHQQFHPAGELQEAARRWT